MSEMPTIATDITQVHAATSYLFDPDKQGEALRIDPWAKQSFVEVITLLTNRNKFLLPVPNRGHEQNSPSLVSACAEVAEEPVPASTLDQNHRIEFLKKTALDIQHRLDRDKLCSWLHFQFGGHVWPQYMRTAGWDPINEAREALVHTKLDQEFLSFLEGKIKNGKLKLPVEFYQWTPSGNVTEHAKKCLAYAASVAYRAYPYMAALSKNDAECVYHPHEIRTLGQHVFKISKTTKNYAVFPWGSILAGHITEIRQATCGKMPYPTEDGIKRFGIVCRTLRDDKSTSEMASVIANLTSTINDRKDVAAQAAAMLYRYTGIVPELRQSIKQREKCAEKILNHISFGITTIEIATKVGVTLPFEISAYPGMIVYACQLAISMPDKFKMPVKAKLFRGKIWNYYEQKSYDAVINPIKRG
jgi:hypothetical protein